MKPNSSCHLEHIAWQVMDPAAAANWYVSHLGFRLRHRAGGVADAHFIQDEASGICLEFYRSPDLPVPDFPGMHPLANHLAITVSEPAETLSRLLAAGASLVADFPVSAGGDRLAMLRDPWGLPLQLVARQKKLGCLKTLCVGLESLGHARGRADLLPTGFLSPSPAETIRNGEHGECPLFATVEDALAEGDYDLALISVPNNTKNLVDLEEQLLKARIPIACTKLRLQNWSDYHRLVLASAEYEVPYYCNDHYHRSSTFVTAAARLGEIGRLQAVDFRCRLPGNDTGFSPWTGSYRHLVLEDLAYHHFSTLAFLTKGFRVGRGWCSSRSFAADGVTRNDVQFLASMETGWQLNYCARWGSSGSDCTSWPGEFRMEGDGGVLVVSQERLSIKNRILAPEQLNPAVDWMTAVIDHLKNKREPACLALLSDYLPVVEMIQRGLEMVDICEKPAICAP